MNVPNTVTVIRMALAPVFAALWLDGRHVAALIVLASAGAGDILDGLLARALNQRTRLGAALDPIADKLFMLVTFVVAARSGALPTWLAVLVIGRDALLAAEAAWLKGVRHLRFDPLRFHPTRLGKYAAFYQLATVAAALSVQAFAPGNPRARAWISALTVVTAIMTVLTGAQYLVRGDPAPPPSIPAAPGAQLGRPPTGRHGVAQ